MAAKAENEAYSRAVRWVGLDPTYGDKVITGREEMLMMLAIRCLWAPHLVDEAINRAVAIAVTREEFGDGGDRDPA